MSPAQEETIRENAGDEMNANIQDAGGKKAPGPDSNTGGVGDPEAPTGSGNGNVGSSSSETAAFIEEAEEAKAAFAGTGDVPGAAGIIESDADGQTASGDNYGSTVDTEAPERAREQAEEESSDTGDRQPTMGEMLASELGSEPSMKWESKIVEKMAGHSGAMDEEDKTEG